LSDLLFCNDNDNDNDNDTMQRNSNVVYLYYTESVQDANDDCSDTSSCSDENAPLGNRLYRYMIYFSLIIFPLLKSLYAFRYPHDRIEITQGSFAIPFSTLNYALEHVELSLLI